MLTIRNTFHNTETRIHRNIGDILTTTQYNRIMQRLCVSKDCCCGGHWGSGFRFEYAGKNAAGEYCYRITEGK